MNALIPSIAFSAGLVLAGCVSLPSSASEASGEIRLLPVCPGDAERPEISSTKHLDLINGAAEALGALLLPLVGVLVKEGLSIAGQRFSEAALEQTVDMLHSGEFRLYQTQASIAGGTVDLSTAAIVPANRCLLLISKGTVSKNTNEEVVRERKGLVKRYKMLKEFHALHEYGSQLRQPASYSDGETKPICCKKIGLFPAKRPAPTRSGYATTRPASPDLHSWSASAYRRDGSSDRHAG